MLDKNGIEMKTGDIVKIENAFFENDNGYYFITCTPGDPTWSGTDYSLQKICKNGRISTAKHNIAFWPLAAFTNDRFKNQQAREHNKQFATIEVIFNIDNTEVIKHFEEEAQNADERTECYKRRFCHESIIEKEQEIANFYHETVTRLTDMKAVKTNTYNDLISKGFTPEVATKTVNTFKAITGYFQGKPTRVTTYNGIELYLT